MGMDHGIWMAIAGCYGDETCISIGDMGILYDIMGFLQTTICECIWKICRGSGWVNCSSMLSQCQSAMLYAITGWRFQHGDLRSWGQPTNRPFARWWFQIVVVWLWTYMNIKCVYIYITIHIISDTFRQSRDHLRFLDRECWDVIHLWGGIYAPRMTFVGKF